MPVNDCIKEGKPGKRWGNQGFCYLFEPGDTKSRSRAISLATRQGLAIGEVQRDNQRRADARGRKTSRGLVPIAIERSYFRMLDRRVSLANDKVVAKLTRPITKSVDSRQDISDLAEIMRLIAALQLSFKNSQEPSKQALSRTAISVEGFTTQQVGKQLLAAAPAGQVARVGLSLSTPATAIRNRWIKKNVSLIKSIDRRYFRDVRRVIRQGFQKGRTTEAIMKTLEERFQVSRSRARLIARDQVSKLNGNITKQKQSKAGVKSYEWLTAGDERVRETHMDNNGKVFKWNDPPSTGHPGDDINCRCIAIPIFED